MPHPGAVGNARRKFRFLHISKLISVRKQTNKRMEKRNQNPIIFNQMNVSGWSRDPFHACVNTPKMSINSPSGIYLDCTKWYWQVDYSDVPQRTQRSASTSSATASYTSAHLHHLDRSNNRMDNDQVIQFNHSLKIPFWKSPPRKVKNWRKLREAWLRVI